LGELALLPHRHLAVFEGPTSRGGKGREEKKRYREKEGKLGRGEKGRLRGAREKCEA